MPATPWLKRTLRPLQRRASVRLSEARGTAGAPGVLGLNPRPLILPGRAPGGGHLVVAWSPKSACTHVLVWALRHQGLLEEAAEHHDWVHRYRRAVYYERDAHRAAMADVLGSRGAGHVLLRVTRAPLTRMVSIFHHVLRNRRLWREVGAATGRDVGREGLSLADLDRYMGRRDLSAWGTTDPHFCVQDHPALRLAYDRRVTVNVDEHDLDAALSAVEAEWAGPGAAIDAARMGEVTRRERHAPDAAWGGRGPIEEHRFRPSEVEQFPKSALLAAPFADAMTRRRHAADVGRVASGDSAGRIFARAGPAGA